MNIAHRRRVSRVAATQHAVLYERRNTNRACAVKLFDSRHPIPRAGMTAIAQTIKKTDLPCG